MWRRRLFAVLALISILLFVGCDFATDEVHEWGEDFFEFQKRFNRLPDGIILSSVETDRQDNGGILHNATLVCNDDKSQHHLKIIENSNGCILNITLESENADTESSCFAEISYHVYCSLGFADEDLKGNASFATPDAFYNYFDLFSHTDTENAMWCNGYEVTYTYYNDSKIRCFTIIL